MVSQHEVARSVFKYSSWFLFYSERIYFCDWNLRRYVFLGVYTVEMILKILARGFVADPYTYLRDGWNVLDFIVVILG